MIGEVTIYQPGQTGEIDMCTLNSRVTWFVRGIDAAVVQLACPGRTYPTNAVVTVNGSNDNNTFVAIDGGVATLTAAGATAAFDVTGFMYVAAILTTIGTGTAPIPFFVTLFGRPGVKA